MLHPISWSQALPAFAAALAFGYLCGAIPFGLILTRLAGTEDLRAIGSGNIGATNVLRTGRKGLAAATLLCDMLKGTLAVLIAAHFAKDLSSHEAALAAGNPGRAAALTESTLGPAIPSGDRVATAAAWDRLGVFRWETGDREGALAAHARALEILPRSETLGLLPIRLVTYFTAPPMVLRP